MKSSMTKELVISFIIMMFLVSCDVNEQIKINQDRGNEIIKSLNDFYFDNESFPKQLDELVPKYINELPEPIIGKDFLYLKDDIDEYYLCFKPTFEEKYSCCYIQRLGIWDCSRGH